MTRQVGGGRRECQVNNDGVGVSQERRGSFGGARPRRRSDAQTLQARAGGGGAGCGTRLYCSGLSAAGYGGGVLDAEWRAPPIQNLQAGGAGYRRGSALRLAAALAG